MSPFDFRNSNSNNNNNSSSESSQDSDEELVAVEPIKQQQQQQQQPPPVVVVTPRQHSLAETAAYVLLAGAVAAAVALFSTHLPFWLDPTPDQAASTSVYQHAAYAYDPQRSHFDNSFLTYGTDYGLAVAMLLSAWSIACSSRSSSSTIRQQPQNSSLLLFQTHVTTSRGMLLTYMLSVTAGGMAHQTFTTLEQRNTMLFRILWTICVGSVTAASGFMGSVGTCWAAHDATMTTTTTSSRSCRNKIPVVPASFWIAYAVAVTAVVVVGGWSYQRPAADIFVAGITQFPSTFYVMALLVEGLPTLPLSKPWRWCGLVVFILNAPLLPLYPLLVYYCTDWSLGQVNAVLHTNLLLAWTGQGLVLRAVAAAWEQAHISPEPAVPVVRPKQQGSIQNKLKVR